MTKQRHESVSQDLPPAIAGVKRPYQKPAFSSESVFETMALACGKMRGQAQDNCRRSAATS